MNRSDDIESLRALIDGPVLTHDDSGYDDEVAAFNTTAQHRPEVVVGATSAQDVQHAVTWAAARDLPVAVQATGHGAVVSYAGGVLVSTKRMQDLRVDPNSRTVTVGAGVKWRAVVDAAAPFELAPLSGSSSDAGAVGYTLGGGLPLLGRTFGFASDHVRSFDLVTADGSLKRVSLDENADLFWALRGGKANVGIVTSMTIGLVPAATIYGGAVYFDGTYAEALLRAYAQWAPSLPDSITTSFKFLRLPPMPEVPEILREKLSVQICVAHVGDPEEGSRLLEPILQAAPILLDDIREMPYTDADLIHRDPDHPLPVHECSALMNDLTEEAIDALLSATGPSSECPLVMVELRHLGGALSLSEPVSDAVGARDAAYCLFLLGILLGPAADAVPGALVSVMGEMAPYTNGRTFVNLHGAPTTDTDRARPWSPDIYDRLRHIKATSDPGDLFRFGHALTT
ncbi:MAG: FAD-binding oxidoreductase [Actinomycetota bacterium]